MPHRRRKSLVDDRPPKRRGANRRKAKRDPTSEFYGDLQEDRPVARSKRPRATAKGRRTRSGPARRKRGKKTAAAKRSSQRRSA
jgi:hypothetical protein